MTRENIIKSVTIASIYNEQENVLLRRCGNSREIEIYFSFVGNNTKILLNDLRLAFDILIKE